MFWILLALVLSLSHSEAGYGDNCQTPSNEAGICLPIKSCHNLISIVNKHGESRSTVSELQYVRRSICGQYRGVHHVCCANEHIRLNSLGENILKNQICGVYSAPKVSHGQEADLSQFPYMALLKYTDGNPFQCGGTLISQRYVLTAAHCITDSLSEVRLGEHKISTNPDCAYFGAELTCAGPYEDIAIEKIIAHQGYNSDKNMIHDIALIRLKHEVAFKDHIKPICLPITRRLRNKRHSEYYVAGWGFTETGKTSDVLMWVEVPHRDRTECERSFNLRSSLGEGIICAGGDELMDSCRGDSGGPIMSLTTYNRKLRFVQFGVVSLGIKSCGQKNYPALYTNVSNYVQWITDHMEE